MVSESRRSRSRHGSVQTSAWYIDMGKAWGETWLKRTSGIVCSPRNDQTTNATGYFAIWIST